ncbi:MAG: FG-GAP-like repeat-containing protein [Caldimonas sp.]
MTLVACSRNSGVPEDGTPAARQAAAAFFTGVAALEVGDDVRAGARLEEVTKLAPGEPGGWANWALLALRQGNFDLAAERLKRARELAPKDGQLATIAGVLESRRGKSAEAITAFRDAAQRLPGNLRVAYLLAQELERRGAPENAAETRRVIDGLLTVQPDNLAVLLEVTRLAARRDDGAVVQSSLAKIAGMSAAWPPAAKAQLADIQGFASQRDFRTLASRMSRLRNALTSVDEYQVALSVIKAPAGADAEPVGQPLALKALPAERAPADAGLRFAVGGSGDEATGWSWVGAIRLDDVGRPMPARANASELLIGTAPVRLAFPGGGANGMVGPDSVLQIDFSYDFKTDLVLAGGGGVRLHRQVAGGQFEDVTAATGLSAAVVNAPYTGAWSADIEADGDLDIVLGRADAAPVVLRNNGDGSLTAIAPFAGVSGLQQFVWVDLDGDGVCDVALIDGAGQLRVFMNRRQGQFVERAAPPGFGGAKAIAIGPTNRSGGFGLLVVQAGGAIVQVADSGVSGKWDVVEAATIANAVDFLKGSVRLLVGDVDNNGVLDWALAHASITSTSAEPGVRVWLGQPDGTMKPLEQRIELGAVLDLADLSGNGHLDLVGLSATGQARVGTNRPALAYHWQVVRPRAAQAFGDQRINPFGVGGAIEIRAGLQTTRRPITGPAVHFGLGTLDRTDIVRVLWPNGVVQAEFDAKADQSVAAEQRLKGSCPYMFAYDGTAMTFVKDTVPWGSAIGLRINTLGSAKIAATEEWYRIPGRQLVPRDGYYDIRITGELWEVYYYDFLQLTGVDHPEGTAVFVDERFVIPPVTPAITVVETPRPLKGAFDDRGADVGAVLSALDDRLLDSFGRGQYQGVTRDHHVELDLGPEAEVDGPLYLIAHGSLRPTDSSINVALSQGKNWAPRGLSLEVPDGKGGWKVARDELGFPAGRRKTILVDLAGVFVPGTPRRVRLRTNLEVYWDQIEWARGLPSSLAKTFAIPTASVDLHYRGYSAITTPPAGAPEIPDYQRRVATQQRWRDLTGFFTRYGDVSELLKSIDDRYVIMNAGDEMSFRFPAAQPPAPGMLRDFVIKGDGWIKDGDYNSTFSQTVLPLPHHGERDYSTAPGRLEDEWVYRRHAEDWQTYHTRYVGVPLAGRPLSASAR